MIGMQVLGYAGEFQTLHMGNSLWDLDVINGFLNVLEMWCCPGETCNATFGRSGASQISFHKHLAAMLGHLHDDHR